MFSQLPQTRLSAVILAAGRASRMGRFKPLLPLGDRTVIERVTALFRESGVRDIRVVIGHRGDEIVELLVQCASVHAVRIVENFDYDNGMLSSVRAGVAEIDPAATDAFFMLPADICLVRPLTVRLLAAAWERSPGKLLHPVYDGERGHPPLIPSALIPEILNGDGDGKLKAILARHEPLSIEIPVPDRQILRDMDRPDDYSDVLSRFERYDIPTTGECDTLLTDVLDVPERVIAHSRRVEQTARRLAKALQAAGVAVDLELLSAAALLHDIAKGEKDHAERGAALLREIGFPRVAAVVARHTDLFSPDATGAETDVPIDEAALLYLADKLTAGDRPVSLEARFGKALERFGDNFDVRAAILRRKAVADSVKRKVERLLGCSIEVLLPECESCTFTECESCDFHDEEGTKGGWP